MATIKLKFHFGGAKIYKIFLDEVKRGEKNSLSKKK